MAAERNLFSQLWYGGRIPANLEILWEMSGDFLRAYLGRGGGKTRRWTLFVGTVAAIASFISGWLYVIEREENEINRALSLISQAPDGTSREDEVLLLDGTYFTTICSSTAASHLDLCHAYVVTIGYGAVFHRVADYRACPPNYSVGWRHVAHEVKSWADAHPELWHLPLVPFVSQGLSELFPCWGERMD